MATPQEQPRAEASVVASCTATDCSFNENEECRAGNINVEFGQDGKAVCATYDPEKPKARP